MPEEVAVETTTEVADNTEMLTLRHRILCPECGCDRMTRIARVGLVRRFVYPMFGYFPWRCRRCGTIALLKHRYQRHRHHRRTREKETYEG